MNSLIVRIVTYIVILLIISGCDQQCESIKLRTFPQYKTEHELFLYKKNCGATTGFVYELTFRGTSKQTREIIILRFDDGRFENWPIDESQLIDAKWDSNNHIQIELKYKSRIFYKANHLRDINVVYSIPPGSLIY